MKSVRLLFAVALSLLACGLAQAQTVGLPCTQVCLAPGETLDAKQCKCVKAASNPMKPCLLTCLNPNETLDAGQCKCVKSASSTVRFCGLICAGPGERLDAKECKCVRK